jgi:hypothetical protein
VENKPFQGTPKMDTALISSCGSQMMGVYELLAFHRTIEDGPCQKEHQMAFCHLVLPDRHPPELLQH